MGNFDKSEQEVLNQLYANSPIIKESEQVVGNRNTLNNPLTGKSLQEAMNFVSGSNLVGQSVQERLFNNVRSSLSLTGSYTNYSTQELLNRALAGGLTLDQVLGGFNPLTAINWRNVYYAEGTQGTPFVNGANVAQWDDNSGNAKHLTQGTGASQPVYRNSVAALGNKPALEFNSDFIGLAGASFGTLTQPFSIILVNQYVTTDASSDTPVGAFDDSNVLLQKAAGVFRVWSNVSSGITFDTNVHLIAGVWNGASSKAIYDASITAGTTSGSLAGLEVGGAAGGASSQKIMVPFVGVYVGDITQHPKWENFKAWTSRYGIAANG